MDRNTPLPADPGPWNTDLPLPRVTSDSALFEFQILLGGITLVLSRVHPVFGRKYFPWTRDLVNRLTQALRDDNPSRSQIGSEHLRMALSECEKALDPGTLTTLRRLLSQTLKEEASLCAPDSQGDFTYSDFMADERMLASFPSHTKGMVAVMR